MKQFLNNLWRQFTIGAVNGFVFCILGIGILNAYLWRYPNPMVQTLYFEGLLLFLVYGGTAKFICYLIFRIPRNIFIEWQICGLITSVLLSLTKLSEPNGWRLWFFVLAILSLYNFVFAYFLKLIKSRILDNSNFEV